MHLPDDHMRYAAIWFSLASLLLIAFAVWLRGLLASACSAAGSNSAVYPSPVAINSLGTSSSVGRIRA